MLNEKKFILSLVHHVPGKNPTTYARRVPPISNALRDTILEISLPKQAVDCQKGMYVVYMPIMLVQVGKNSAYILNLGFCSAETF